LAQARLAEQFPGPFVAVLPLGWLASSLGKQLVMQVNGRLMLMTGVVSLLTSRMCRRYLPSPRALHQMIWPLGWEAHRITRLLLQACRHHLAAHGPIFSVGGSGGFSEGEGGSHSGNSSSSFGAFTSGAFGGNHSTNHTSSSSSLDSLLALMKAN
jgi:hypothetical protein